MSVHVGIDLQSNNNYVCAINGHDNRLLEVKLAWAFVEAANMVKAHNPLVRYYERKKAKTNGILTTKALAHKLARAYFYIMKDGVSFSNVKCFGESIT